MRILQFFAENIKRIRVVQFTPDPNLVRVNGENESGKTSTLDGIIWALQGAAGLDLVPVREGEERGMIRLVIGDTQVEYIVTRTIERDRTSRLTVESAAGALYPKPQAKLSELFGSISLDPQEFQRMNDRQRLDTLKQIVSLEVDIDQLDRQNAVDFETRTQVNREVESARGRVATYAAGVVKDMDVTPVDVASIIQEMEAATTRDRNRAADERLRSDILRKAAELRQYAESNREHIKQLQQEITILEERAADAENSAAMQERAIRDMPPLADPVDVSDLSIAIQEGNKENSLRQQQRTQRENHATAKQEFEQLQDRAKQLTTLMDERKRTKSTAIAGAKFPVPGLGFGETGVTYNGFPFNQASGAVQLRVSFAIAAALKPRLPVIIIRDGSLLDEKSMVMLQQLATEYGAQCWIERVGHDPVGIILEDGGIVSIDGVRVDIKP